MKHDFGKGRVATRCGTFLLITNLLQTPVLPNSAQVKLRGWSRFRRKVYSIDLGGLGSVRHGAAIAPTSTAKFHVSFMVLPEVKTGSVVADIIIIDQFGNSHRVKGVRFTNEQPHAMPWDVPTS